MTDGGGLDRAAFATAFNNFVNTMYEEAIPREPPVRMGATRLAARCSAPLLFQARTSSRP
jgi:hypothetical protein